MEAKTKQAELSLRDLIASHALSTGGDSSTNLNGLQQIVDITPTADTFGNISRADATNAFWRNNSTTSVGSFASGGLSAMRTMYNTCSQYAGMDAPNLIITTQTVFEYYEKVLQVQERFTDKKVLDGGFQNLQFKGATIVWDPYCADGYMYFLNTNYLSLVVHQDADFQVLPFVKPENQDAKTAQIIWMGNLTASNCAKQGVLSGITA